MGVDQPEASIIEWDHTLSIMETDTGEDFKKTVLHKLFS